MPARATGRPRASASRARRRSQSRPRIPRGNRWRRARASCRSRPEAAGGCNAKTVARLPEWSNLASKHLHSGAAHVSAEQGQRERRQQRDDDINTRRHRERFHRKIGFRTNVVSAAGKFFHAEYRRHRGTERHHDELIRQGRKHDLDHMRKDHVLNDLQRGKAQHFSGLDLRAVHGGKPGTLDFAQVSARIERCADQHRRVRRERDARLRQREKEKEDLHELRRVRCERHIQAHDAGKPRRSETLNGRARETDQHAEREGQHGDLQTEPRAAEQIRPLLENGPELKRHVVCAPWEQGLKIKVQSAQAPCGACVRVTYCAEATAGGAAVGSYSIGLPNQVFQLAAI
ncbi:hypothetical protein PSP6_280087 [Paraburkholderia tropica]|nr:hypothetical protein PSP6_280087 [Paraburkholderia tropica]